MQITYIFHSGFWVEASDCILIFDCWMDPPGVTRRLAEIQKPVYVFASHFHEDHFSHEILTWRERYANTRFTYILSKDIYKHRRALREEAEVWLAKGGEWSDEHLHVFATGSNDSGVSWVVEVEGRRLFHAGDLCNWYARFLAEDEVPERIISEEFGEINPRAEEKQYLGELKEIHRVTDHFDVAMIPVDGRIGNGYTLGGRQFIERFEVGLFIPMHFVMSGFESAWRMEPFCQERDVPFWCIGHEGETISLLSTAQTTSADSKSDLIIRHTRPGDIPRLQEIYALARQFMAETGNPNQWAPTYPSLEQLNSDIASGDSYVCLYQGHIEATFLLRGGNDPTYEHIYEGAWLDDAPYATIHRIASSGKVRGIFRLVLDFALQHYHTLRIDTHRDNRVMQHLFTQAGFAYCGIIHCWNGDERLAYQYRQ